MRKFDYSITVHRLPEPIGGALAYVATLARFYETSGTAEKNINPGIGESWGKTEDEARSKLRMKVESWITAHRSE